ncbi:retrovirus-related Pol polyprotein from type-1 retrotransposable element R2 [Trichonephila clavipes]|nr:retrovirus-related Pol polyprotein from type-1 retrotransposable element R2 [Trichonephila clavipes]
MKAFHDHFQIMETAKMLAAPSQGKVLDCVAMAPASSHFISDGKYTRFADWHFIHKVRLNLVPLNANKRGPAPSLCACRKCGKWDETLPHVINHCTSYSAVWQGRHNAVLARIMAAVAFKGTILSENQVVGPNHLRPDLVAQIDNTIYIIDVTIPFENRKQAFSQARERKVSKYTELISHFDRLGFQLVQIVPILVGSLGAWDPGNDAFLRKVATRRYLKMLRKLCVSDCIRWSRDIYIQHLTGAQQYSTGAAGHPNPPGTQERVSGSAEQTSSQDSASTQQSYTPNSAINDCAASHSDDPAPSTFSAATPSVVTIGNGSTNQQDQVADTDVTTKNVIPAPIQPMSADNLLGLCAPLDSAALSPTVNNVNSPNHLASATKSPTFASTVEEV